MPIPLHIQMINDLQKLRIAGSPLSLEGYPVVPPSAAVAEVDERAQVR